MYVYIYIYVYMYIHMYMYICMCAYYVYVVIIKQQAGSLSVAPNSPKREWGICLGLDRADYSTYQKQAKGP